MNKNLNLFALTTSLAMFVSGTAHGQAWTLVDDFETGYTIGATVNGINGWTATTPERATAVADPLAGVRATVLKISQGAGAQSYSRPTGAPIIDNSVGTFFFELLVPAAPAGNANVSLGLSHLEAPSGYLAFKPQFRLLNSIFSPRSGGAFIDTEFSFPSDTYMKVWLVADHTTDTVDIYVQSPDGLSGQILVADDFGFRTAGTPEELIRFFIVQATGRDIILDNLYIDNTGQNLTDPTFVDSDNDGLSDGWEIKFFGNLDRDGTGDFEPDGLTDRQEFDLGTDPTLMDSDGDTLNDGDEFKGTSNLFEGISTSPKLRDTDGDGVDDFQENGSLNTQFGNAPTNPNLSDTDGDGMPDGYELANNTPGTALDPNDDGSTDSTQRPGDDRDGDKLANIAEFDPTQGPNTLSVRTRADIADTDDDGYTDFEEDNGGTFFAADFTGSNPTIKDTDGDGLFDGQENPNAPFVANTLPANSNPNIFDTDGDGFKDSFEFSRGTNPNDINSFPVIAAGFNLVEDFEAFTIGETFDGLNGWTSTFPEAALTQDEPIAGGDKVGSITSADGIGTSPVYKSLSDLGLQIGNTTTGTLFFQLYASTASVNHSFGLSDDAAPVTFANFEAQAGIVPLGDIGIRDGGAFRISEKYPTNTWINVWIVADNTTDTIKVYFESPTGRTGQFDVTPDSDLDPYSFRNGTENSLSTLLIVMAGTAANGDSVYVDNFYVDINGANLTTPAAAKPIAAVASDIAITGTKLNSNGDLEITFTPGGATGYVLTSASANDLATGTFTNQGNYSYDAIDTFTVPATFINANTKFFFRVETNP